MIIINYLTLLASSRSLISMIITIFVLKQLILAAQRVQHDNGTLNQNASFYNNECYFLFRTDTYNCILIGYK